MHILTAMDSPGEAPGDMRGWGLPRGEDCLLANCTPTLIPVNIKAIINTVLSEG